MTDDVEIFKDFFIKTPIKSGTEDSKYPVKRDWTLAEIEDVCWQARAAGTVDSQAVELSRDGVRVKEIPAWEVEIPAALRRPAVRVGTAPEEIVRVPGPSMGAGRSRRTVSAWWSGLSWEARFILAGLPFSLPVLLMVLVSAWQYCLGRVL